MSRPGTYQIRIDDDEKKAIFAVFNDLGITPAQAVKMFFTQVRRTHSIPFPIEYTPNDETAQAIAKAKQGVDLVVCNDADDLFDKLGI